jgi:hypothetical protein
MMRVVVAIDPAMTSGDEADETGIIVAGKDKNGHGYVLADLSGRNPPIEGQHRAARDIDAGHGTKDYVGIRVPRKQTYTLSGFADLIEAGVRMVQPDVVKWAALPACGVVPLWRRHTASKVPHQTQPTIGHTANLHLVASLLHMTKPCEWNDTTPCQHSVFENPPKPADGLFHLPTGPGLGLQINEAELAKRRVPIA